MEGSGRGALGAYNAQGYTDLSSFLTDRPMRNGDAWLEELLQRNEMLGGLTDGFGCDAGQCVWAAVHNLPMTGSCDCCILNTGLYQPATGVSRPPLWCGLPCAPPLCPAKRLTAWLATAAAHVSCEDALLTGACCCNVQRCG